MNYEEMSDLQINLLVANAIGVDAAENSGVVFGAVKHEGDNVVSVIGVVDYCNNPSDAWPIIDKCNICIHNDEMEGRSYACTFDKHGYVNQESYCDKTLRAAMIVFLMMSEQGK